jgi:hypothetical protein
LLAFLQSGPIASIFTDPDLAVQALEQEFVRTTSQTIRSALILIAVCASGGEELRRASGNHRAWSRLADLVGKLLTAEVTVSTDRAPPGSPLIDAAYLKSAGPSRVILEISRLASGREADDDRAAMASTLGQLFTLVDDLADLVDDARRRRPNTALIGVGDSMRSSSVDLSDPLVYEVVDSMCDQLSKLLLPAEVGTPRFANPVAEQFALDTVAVWLDGHHATPEARGWPRVAPPSARAAPVVDKALGAVLREQATAYAETAHHLRFPRGDRQRRAYETHPATLSFRAVALDALLDARDAGLEVPFAVIAREALALLKAKHEAARGGWSYLSDVPELPPDADDLGQVVQALVRIGGASLASGADEPIRLALDSADGTGGFPTWILEPRLRRPIDVEMLSYLEVMGGGGIHPEVVANLLAGLIHYDRERYRIPLERGADYLESVQGADGSWTSKWYRGPFYGTYRAAVVLSQLRPTAMALQGARVFLRSSQTTTKAWGGGRGEPLSTSFALLALAAIGDARDADLLAGGEEALVGACRRGFAPVPWIEFPTLDGTVRHGSATMTAAWALKALLAVARARLPNTAEGAA